MTHTTRQAKQLSRRTAIALGVSSMVATVLPLAARAQSTSAAVVQLRGKTLDGKDFDIQALQGKVVMVMFWSTGCAVCRDKMPELRANYQGWAGKPFELVLVSTDRSMKDIDGYNALINQSVPLKQRFISLWAQAPGFSHNLGDVAKLPATFVINAQGQVADRYLGRVPVEAWDKVAELLP